jgi:hypothetical protein
MKNTYNLRLPAFTPLRCNLHNPSQFQSFVMTFHSSSSSDEASVPPRRQNTGFETQSSIPRMTGYQIPSEDAGSTTSDGPESTFYLPIECIDSESSPVYQSFLQRQTGDPLPFCECSFPPPIDIPEPVKCSVDKCIIHLLDLPTLIESRDNRQFLHSWINLSTVTSVEAQRQIAAYYTASYRALNRELFNPELSWGAARISRPPTKSNQSYHQFHIFHYIGLGLKPPEAEQIWLTGNVLCFFRVLQIVSSS